MEPKTYLEHLAKQMVGELKPNADILHFTNNSDVIGAFSEASLRQIIARIVSPLRVSHGAVISPELCPANVKQIDTIIWNPQPAPAIFQAGDFGLISRGSCLGFLEIKRTSYCVDASLEERLSEDFVKTVTSEHMKAVDEDDNEVAYERRERRGLGVVCIRKQKGNSVLDKLVSEEKVVVLFDEVDGGELKENPKAIHTLLNFLIYMRHRAVCADGHLRVELRHFMQGEPVIKQEGA